MGIDEDKNSSGFVYRDDKPLTVVTGWKANILVAIFFMSIFVLFFPLIISFFPVGVIIIVSLPFLLRAGFKKQRKHLYRENSETLDVRAGGGGSYNSLLPFGIQTMNVDNLPNGPAKNFYKPDTISLGKKILVWLSPGEIVNVEIEIDGEIITCWCDATLKPRINETMVIMSPHRLHKIPYASPLRMSTGLETQPYE